MKTVKLSVAAENAIREVVSYLGQCRDRDVGGWWTRFRGAISRKEYANC
jgi:hypothetical protein